MDKYETTLAAGIEANRATTAATTGSTTFPKQPLDHAKPEKRALTSGIWYVRDRNNIDARFGLNSLPKTIKSPTPATIWAEAMPPC